MYTYAYYSIINKSQKEETAQVSNMGQTHKQNVVHPYNGILLILKNEGSSDTCYNMNEV